jgi:hypothetical protein
MAWWILNCGFCFRFFSKLFFFLPVIPIPRMNTLFFTAHLFLFFSGEFWLVGGEGFTLGAFFRTTFTRPFTRI